MTSATPLAARLGALVISAPFGNYVQPADATPTLGTFTAERRPGRLWRIVKTVRVYPRLGAWVNRIGLRNPGIDWLAERVAAGRIDAGDKLVSIHGFAADDWWRLLDRGAAVQPLGIELNMSCPNVGEIDWPPALFSRAAACGVPIVVKLPPVHYETMLTQALDAGLRAFHCCNTLPVPAGGLSGKPLKPVALACLRRVRETAPDALLIGGGGITRPADVDDHLAAGADRVAIGTKAMDPRLLLTDAPLRPLIRHARARLANPAP